MKLRLSYNLALYDQILVQNLQVIQSREALAGGAVSELQQASGQYRHVWSINSDTTQHIVAVNTNQILAACHRRRNEYLQGIQRTCHVRTIHLTSGSSTPALNKGQNRQNICCNNHVVRSKLLCSVVDNRASNFNNFAEALIMLCLGYTALEMLRTCRYHMFSIYYYIELTIS